MWRFLQICLLIGVMLGIVGPKSSALMAELGLIDARVIVICTGNGLETITLDENGNPIQGGPERHEPCPLIDAVDTPSLVASAAPFASLPALADYPRPEEVSGLQAAAVLPHPRAPPLI